MNITPFCGFEWGTFSKVTIGDFECYSLEQPWNNNIPFRSCIPEGTYQLVPHSSDNHPDTFAMVNEDLEVFHYDHGHGRYACLLHPGNWVTDFQGCMGFGDGLGMSEGKWIITNSRNTTNKVLNLIREGITELTIGRRI